MKNQTGIIKNHENRLGTMKKPTWNHENHEIGPGTMKNQPGTMKNHENRLGTMKNGPGTVKNRPGTVKTKLEP